MGWIQAGNIEFFSVADTINSVVMALFSLLKELINPFFFMALILFFLSLMAYFYFAIKQKIKETGAETNV